MRSSYNSKVLGLKLSFRSVFSALLFISCLFAGLVLSSIPVLASDGPPPAPTLISITEGTETASSKPLITGLTVNGTQVDVFIDDRLDGSAVVRDHPSGTANFYYYPLNRLSSGQHTLGLIAVKDGNISQPTQVSFEVVDYVPSPTVSAPTLFTPVFNLQTIESQPFIVGLVKNDCKVKIFIDGKYDGEMLVKNHPSSTANFAYKPKSDLSIGTHNVKATAVNWKTGEQSKISSMVTFQVKAPYPAPTLFKPTVSSASWSRPNINGVAKNDSYVDIYVNDISHRVNLEADPSGTNSFTYRPEQSLLPQMNVIFAVAHSPEGRMSRKSNVIYWDLTPKEELVKEAEKEPVAVEDITEPEAETPEIIEPEVGEPEIEVETEDRGEEADVTIEEEGEEGETIVEEGEEVDLPADLSSGEEDEAGVAEEGEEEVTPGPNWSKIIGLVILAVLIIVLIIQLLKKEEPEDKKGETLKLFEEGEEKGESKSAAKKETKKKENDNSDTPDIPPPPPPSSNLPF